MSVRAARLIPFIRYSTLAEQCEFFYTKNMDGWIKLHRQSLKSSVWENPNIWMVWCWCLMKANHEPHKFPFNGDDIEIESGQFITGIFQAVSEINPKRKKTGITNQKYRSAINYLEKTQRLTIKTTNKFSLITVLNWSKYQDTNKQINKQITNQQQTNNYIQEHKKNKNNTFEAKAPSKKTPMNPEELNDGEITYEVEGAKPRSTKPKGRQQKVAVLVSHCFTIQGKNAYITKALSEVGNLIMEKSRAVCSSEEEALKEALARVDIAQWHYSQAGIKEFGLAKVYENWDLILSEWNQEKRKHNKSE